MTTDPDFAAMRQRCEAATAGPWTADLQPSGPCGARVYREHIVGPYPDRRVILLRPPTAFNGPGRANRDQEIADAKFTAHARTDLPTCLARIEQQEREIENLAMSDECLDMVRDCLVKHGVDMSATPAMNYPEAIHSLLFTTLRDAGALPGHPAKYVYQPNGDGSFKRVEVPQPTTPQPGEKGE